MNQPTMFFLLCVPAMSQVTKSTIMKPKDTLFNVRLCLCLGNEWSFIIGIYNHQLRFLSFSLASVLLSIQASCKHFSQESVIRRKIEFKCGWRSLNIQKHNLCNHLSIHLAGVFPLDFWGFCMRNKKIHAQLQTTIKLNLAHPREKVSPVRLHLYIFSFHVTSLTNCDCLCRFLCLFNLWSIFMKSIQLNNIAAAAAWLIPIELFSFRCFASR